VATKTELKEQARAERIARAEAEADAARRRRRLLLVGGIGLVAVIVIAVAIAAGSGSSSGTTSSSSAAGTVNRLLTGLPQQGNTLGKPGAPVTVTVFEDLECPICREFTLGAENQLIANDVRAGRAKLVFRSLQTATPDATTFQVQQQAAVAAGKQQKLWHFVELFYHQQGPEGTPYVTESYLDKLAHQVPGLDYKAWLAARKADLSHQVSGDESLAHSKNFDSTPTIVVKGPKGSHAPAAGSIPYGSLENMVKRAGG
jgi:protein-disulfide isomerase